MRRKVNGWKVLTSEAAWKRWLKEECVEYAGQPPKFPCLAQCQIASDENGMGVYLSLSQIDAMRAILFGWVAKPMRHAEPGGKPG